MSEDVQEVIYLCPADILIFCDETSRRPVEGGVNRVAVVIDETHALYCERGSVRRVELAALPRLINLNARHGIDDPEIAHKVARYFAQHENQPSHFEAGLKALRVHNLQPLVDGRLFPARPTYQNEAEYELAWQSFKDSLRPFDCIFTVDLESVLSRDIAWATGGPWSHVALYAGAGEIAESVTEGLRRVPLEIYRGRRYWVANYRHVGLIEKPRAPEEAEQAIEAGFDHFAPGYNYRKAIWYGFRAFLGDHDHALVPNSAIYQGVYALIAHV